MAITILETKRADYEAWLRLNQTYAVQYQGDFSPEVEARMRASMGWLRDGGSATMTICEDCGHTIPSHS